MLLAARWRRHLNFYLFFSVAEEREGEMYKPLFLHSIGRHTEGRGCTIGVTEFSGGGIRTGSTGGLLLFLGEELDAASCLAIIIIIIIITC